MSILSDFEDRMAGAVEGLFAGAFRSPVQPVEVAKSLGKAMDDGRTLGVGKVYAPSSFRVQISAADAEKFGTFQETLGGELSTFLVAHAQEQGYSLATKPVIIFEIAENLKLGRFRVAASADTSASAIDAEASRMDVSEGLTGAIERLSMADSDDSPEEPAATQGDIHTLATVTVGDIEHDVVLKGDRVEVGRVGGCEICLQDVNASRRHAAFIREGSGWAIEDLSSTNGTMLDGKRVDRVRLRDGDVIQIGITELTYHEPRI